MNESSNLGFVFVTARVIRGSKTTIVRKLVPITRITGIAENVDEERPDRQGTAILFTLIPGDREQVPVFCEETFEEIAQRLERIMDGMVAGVEKITPGRRR